MVQKLLQKLQDDSDSNDFMCKKSAFALEALWKLKIGDEPGNDSSWTEKKIEAVDSFS